MTTPRDPASRRRLRWLPVLAWAAVIFAGSAVPGSSVPGRFGTIGHAVEYAVLGGLLVFALWRGLSEGAGRVAWTALALCALYAVSDEFHQAFVPQRTPDPLDWTIDVLGASVGIAVVLLRSARAAKRRPSGLVE
jgi:VanZ family protein